MSDYGYERRGGRRARPRSPEYVQETMYVERGAGHAPHDLVYRGREDSIEDIPRDFPPPGGAAYTQTRYRESYAPRRARSVGRRDHPDDAHYAAYGRRPPSRGRDRDDYHSDEYERPANRRRKSIVDQVKGVGESLGLGGVIGAVAGRRSRSRSETRAHDRYDHPHDRRRDRSHSRDRGGKDRWEQAAKAAIVAGAVEAFRSRKEPGKWTGEKGQRVATAALGAAGLGKFLEKEHEPDKHEKRHIAEAALGGLVANRLANGARSRSRGGSDGSRSRSRSRSRKRSRSQSRIRSILGRDRSQSRGRDHDDKDHTVRNVAGAGAAVAAGKAIYDRIRSKSRSRKDRKSPSNEEGPARGRQFKDDRRGEGSTRKRDGSNSSTSSEDFDQQKRKLRGGNPYGQTTYADANPYGAVPPPPMGGVRY